MNVRYRVELNQAERDRLTEMLRGGHHAARKLKRAQILLAADNGATEGASVAFRPTIVMAPLPVDSDQCGPTLES